MPKTISFQLRQTISLSLLLAFLILAVSGALMYIRPYHQATALTHTVVGFVLLLVGLWHIRNNFAPLIKYLTGRASTARRPVSRTFATLLIAATWIVAGSLLKWWPFEGIYTLGNRIRTGQETTIDVAYEQVRFGGEGQAEQIVIDLRKGPYFKWPTYAFWIESEQGEFIQPIYVTHKLARNDFSVRAYKQDGQWRFEDEPDTKSRRWRPESLPVFLHRAGIAGGNGLQSAVVDAYTGATIRNNFILSGMTKKTLPRRFSVYFEINHSFDFNAFYSESRFPDDPVYSGDGYSAQPSLVYRADIDLADEADFVPMSLLGRGHHSGQDGKIHADLSGMTTALELIDRIIVDLRTLKDSSHNQQLETSTYEK